MNIKDYIIDALKVRKRETSAKSRTTWREGSKNGNSNKNHEQYIRCNNIEIQGISATIADDHLGNKVTDIFRCLKTNIDPSDIEDCHRLGNSTPKNTIVRFVKRNFCKKALKAKFDLRKINNVELHFDTSSILYFSENLTPYN